MDRFGTAIRRRTAGVMESDRLTILELKIEIIIKALLAELDSTRGLILMNDLHDIEDHEDWLDHKDTEESVRPTFR